MEDKQPQKSKRVSLEEALQTEMLISQALIDLLIAKGFITQEELLERVREVRKS